MSVSGQIRKINNLRCLNVLISHGGGQSVVPPIRRHQLVFTALFFLCKRRRHQLNDCFCNFFYEFQTCQLLLRCPLEVRTWPVKMLCCYMTAVMCSLIGSIYFLFFTQFFFFVWRIDKAEVIIEKKAILGSARHLRELHDSFFLFVFPSLSPSWVYVLFFSRRWPASVSWLQ